MSELKEKHIKSFPDDEVGQYKLSNDLTGYVPVQCQKADGTKVGKYSMAVLEILKGSTVVVPDCAKLKRPWYWPFGEPEPCYKYRTNEAYVNKIVTKPRGATKCYSKWNPSVLYMEGTKVNADLDHNNLEPSDYKYVEGIHFTKCITPTRYSFEPKH